MLQHFDARRIGELQVVEHEPGEAFAMRLPQQGLDGVDEAHVVRAPAGAANPAELGQQLRELVAHPGRKRWLDALQHLAQQARQQRVRDADVAGPCVHQQRMRAGRGEIADEAGLAESGLANDEARGARFPCRLQGVPLRLAADQARRSQDADRQRTPLDRLVRERARFDLRPQHFGLGVGRDPEAALEHVATVVEGGERRGPVASQVMQPHQAAVAVLGGRIGVDQLPGRKQGRAQLPVGLERRRAFGELAGMAAAALLTRLLQPFGEAAGVGLVDPEQDALGCRFVTAFQIDIEIAAESRDIAALEQVAADRMAQAVQPLAQVRARPIAIDVRPEQRRQDAARRRPLESEIGEEQRVLRLDGDDPAVGAHVAGLACEPQCTAGRSKHGRRRRIRQVAIPDHGTGNPGAGHSRRLA